MKRIATLAIILLMGLTASASSIRYFTQSQAVRTVRYLNAQNEMMIYCGYEYELETYVLINEVWMERVNSAYYEIWVFGFDAYTGDEIYMPLDLGCVWLFSGGRIYNAAQYLRFHTTVRTPNITWYVPHYNPFTRMIHRPGYVRSYHYDIHRYGWMPPAYHYGPGVPPPPLPPYYMRNRQEPAPAPPAAPAVPLPVITDPKNLEEHLLYYTQTRSEVSEAYIAQHFREASRFLLTLDPYVAGVVMSSIRIGTVQNKRYLSSLAQRYGKKEIADAIR